MLAIRMQRTGRKGHAMFRMVVQDSRQTPTSGRVVATLGSYDPHTKTSTLNKEKAGFYLEHGAQPSDRVARLLQKEGVVLPSWVALSGQTAKSTRNPDKLRKNQPAEEKPKTEEAPAPVAATTEEDTTDAENTAKQEAPAQEEAEKTAE